PPKRSAPVPVGPSKTSNRSRTLDGGKALGRICTWASRSASRLQKARKPLGTPPTTSRVRVTGLAMMFASRRTRVSSLITEEVVTEFIARQLHEVAHRLAPVPLELLVGDAIAIA